MALRSENEREATPAPDNPDMVLLLRCLQAIQQAMSDVIVPDLTSQHAITSGHIALRLLENLLAANGRPLSLNWPQPPDAALENAWRASGRDSGAALSGKVLADAMAPLVADGSEEAKRFLETLARSQKAALVRVDPDVARGVADMYRGGRKSDDEPKKQIKKPLLTTDRLTEYLRRKFPDRPDSSVVALNNLPGGMSKQTIKVTTEERGKSDCFIIRKDFELSPADRTVVDEFPLLRFVWDAGGVPMPEPLWLEPDASILGAPFMVMGFVEGSNNYESIAADPKAKERLTNSLAAALARLHSIVPPEAAGSSAQEHMAKEIEVWYSGWKRWQIQPRPLMEGAFAWLRANVPASGRGPSLVHGDVGFHNMLNKDGEVTGLLDWEFAHIGDAAADLVYARPFIETVLDWQSFLMAYEAHGGVAPNAEEEKFYSVWGSARNAAGCGGALKKFHDPEADMRLGASGMTFLGRFELDAFERAIANP
ncbi:MAG: phosphotransferase family protein [Caulobacterales bacterium]